MQNQKAIEKFFKYEPYLHLVFWLMVLLFPYVKYWGKEGGYPNSVLHELNALFFFILFSYSIYFVVLRGRVKKKAIAGLVLFIFCALGHEFFDSFFHDASFQNYTWKRWASHLISFGSFGIIFFALHISKAVYQKQNQLLRLYEENQIANMMALKAQVTPHFLFNTLNSIYTKVSKIDEESSDLILMLSDNIRYFLKEGQKEKVTLNKEIEHIENYIQLQNNRWKDKLVIHFFKDIGIDEVEVVPLLFIPFVENAFKYASQLKGKGHDLTIRFFFKKEQVHFFCENPYPKINPAPSRKERFDSIGLTNVRRRLELSYPDKHELKVSSDKERFIVDLKLTVC